MARAAVCGVFADSAPSRWGTFLTIFGIATGIASALGAAKDIAGGLMPWVIAGVGAYWAFFIAALLVYIVLVSFLFYVWIDECIAGPGRERDQCFSGVVERIDGESGTTFFDVEHPSVLLVVRTMYIDVLLAFTPDRILCSDAPGTLVRLLFKSSQVCGTLGGSAIGGALAGIGGIIAAAAVGAAIGCATIFLCILALVLAVLIVVAAIIIGVLVGGAIGRAASPGPAVPSTSDGTSIAIRDLLSARGPTIKDDGRDGEVVQRFTEVTARIGVAPVGPAYSNDQADEFIPEIADACPI